MIVMCQLGPSSEALARAQIAPANHFHHQEGSNLSYLQPTSTYLHQQQVFPDLSLSLTETHLRQRLACRIRDPYATNTSEIEELQQYPP
jgi:hypothetical protein